MTMLHEFIVHYRATVDELDEIRQAILDTCGAEGYRRQISITGGEGNWKYPDPHLCIAFHTPDGTWKETAEEGWQYLLKLFDQTEFVIGQVVVRTQTAK